VDGIGSHSAFEHGESCVTVYWQVQYLKMIKEVDDEEKKEGALYSWLKILG
jgi:hypothetical protein